MWSAVLVSRNELQLGDQPPYMTTISISNRNPDSKLGSLRNPSPNFTGDVANSEAPAGTAVGAAVSDGCSSFNWGPAAARTTITAGQRGVDYVSFDVASFSRNERRDLKRRLVFELEQVRAVVGRFQAHSSPSNHHLQQPSQAQQKVRSMIMKKCSVILGRLMRQKGAHWFNRPVDVQGMGLHDYHQIIKSPMDLGTVKSKLRKGVYGAPLDFAADVRLTFSNALTYNPVNHDVHILAGQFLKYFDSQFNQFYDRYQQQLATIAQDEDMKQRYQQSFLPETQHLQLLPPASPAQLPQPLQVPVGRMTLAKQLPKPKAKDLNKRPMSLEEKEKLGFGLQNLPQQKMEQVVRIVRRRNDVQAQDGDEIELDFELMDNETLWELDRFLSNCRKSINKIKHNEAITVTSADPPSAPLPPPVNDGSKSPTLRAEPVAAKNWRIEQGDKDADMREGMPAANYLPVEIVKNDAPKSSSSSSSGSSDSSSSSDSDSDSSSDSDSDGGGAKAPPS